MHTHTHTNTHTHTQGGRPPVTPQPHTQRTRNAASLNPNHFTANSSPNSEECQKPQPPLLLKKVLQYTSNLYRSTPSICIAVLSVPLCSEEREILSVLLPFVSQHASRLYCNTPPIRIAVLLGKSWCLWSPGCSPRIMPSGFYSRAFLSPPQRYSAPKCDHVSSSFSASPSWSCCGGAVRTSVLSSHGWAEA